MREGPEVRMGKTETSNSCDESASQEDYINWVKWGSQLTSKTRQGVWSPPFDYQGNRSNFLKTFKVPTRIVNLQNGNGWYFPNLIDIGSFFP